MTTTPNVETALINMLNTGWRVECYYADAEENLAHVLVVSSSEAKLFKRVFHEDAILEAYAWTQRHNKAAQAHPPPGSTPAIYYFGCYGAPGHYLWTSTFRRVVESNIPWSLAELDGQLAPKATGISQKAAQPQGQALVHHKDGWTAVAFWDRSVDPRQGSNSVFILKGTFDFEQAMTWITAIFPKIVSRTEITEFNPNTRD